MIHFNCDVCKRPLDSEHDLRYVVRMEVYAALDHDDAPIDDDRDHLQEMHDILERLDDLDLENHELGDDVYQQLRFDLCGDCRKKFLKDPLGRRLAQLDFSKN
ncbi:MAG: hypothetical protein L0Z07_06455 [Planctomycetes bacterium]|jgi:hypothetical protein|nr:hypothetical protein [Planctomycetota bacterium]